MSVADDDFRAWIETLDKDVIQGEFGYEEGEFSVFPDAWRRFYDQGLSPAEAFARALAAADDARRENERLRLENWERIRREDDALLGRVAG
jgi:hypothetical protein